MRWDRSHESTNVEDRRAEAPTGGGVPIGGILALASRFGWRGILVGLVLVAGLMGYRTCASSPTGNRLTSAPVSEGQAELDHFVAYVFDDVQESWHRQMPAYRDAKLVLFRRAIDSACGTASSAVGPFYCPIDRKVYIDLTFYEQLRQRFGAPGDFAQAYVIAHEVGHHVQNQRGELGRGAPDQIAIELEADCLAGAWAKDAESRGLLEVGDLDEALNAASQIGDDTIQRKTQGHVQPETWTHGSSAQRSAALRNGYERGASGCSR